MYQLNSFLVRLRVWILEKTAREQLLASLVFSFIYIVLICAWYPPFYETNDDWAIERFLLSGNDTVFVSVIWGKINLFLYDIFPAYPIYALSLLFCHWVSFGVLSFAFLQLYNQLKILLILVVYVAISVFYVHFVQSLTFTTASFVLGFTAVFFYLVHQKRGGGKFVHVMFAGGLLAVAYLVRKSAVQGVMLFSAPFLAYYVFEAYKASKLKFSLLSIAVLLFPLVLTFVAEKAVSFYGTSDRYKEFVAFNNYRGKLHDNEEATSEKVITNYGKVVLQNEWIDDDYRMFYSWIFHDEKTFTKEKLHLLLYSLPRLNERFFQFRADLLSQKISDFISKFRDELMLLLLLLVFGALSVEKKRIALNLAVLCCVFAGLFVLAYLIPLKARVFVPILIGASIMSLCLVDLNKVIPKQLSLIFAFLFVVLFCFQIGERQRIIRKHSIERQKLQRVVAEVNENDKGRIVFFHAGSRLLKMQDKNVLSPNDYKVSVDYIPGGWTTFSPYYYDEIKRIFNVERGGDVYAKLINNRKVVFKGGERFVRYFCEYLNKKYKMNVRAVYKPGVYSGSYVLKSFDSDLLGVKSY